MLSAEPQSDAANAFLTDELRESNRATATAGFETLLGFDPYDASFHYLNRVEIDEGVVLWMTFTDRRGVSHPRTVLVVAEAFQWRIAAIDVVEP